jgi:hypothetical protein
MEVKKDSQEIKKGGIIMKKRVEVDGELIGFSVLGVFVYVWNDDEGFSFDTERLPGCFYLGYNSRSQLGRRWFLDWRTNINRDGMFILFRVLGLSVSWLWQSKAARERQLERFKVFLARKRVENC